MGEEIELLRAHREEEAGAAEKAWMEKLERQETELSDALQQIRTLEESVRGVEEEKTNLSQRVEEFEGKAEQTALELGEKNNQIEFLTAETAQLGEVIAAAENTRAER